MNKKIDRALYGPGVIEVALGAVLGLALGVVVACVFLLFKPVKVVKEPPKEAEAGVVYYQPGSENLNKGRGWVQKQQALLAGGAVELSEEELNAWAASRHPGAASATKPAAPAKPGAKPAPGKPGPPAAAPAPEKFLTVGAINFRLKDGRMQLGTKVTLSAFGVAQDFPVIVTGTFAKNGATFVFNAETLYVGSCPLHKLPGVAGPLLRKAAALEPIPDELRAAWSRLTTVAIDGSTLRLAAQ
ncbi:MAG: hypothetical protein HY302_07960 [Opitutae bacterium]|nr:hypothetical protein [Opitutae bacterium]